MKNILTTLLVVISTTILGQGFTYSYVDPCSRQLKTLQVSNNQAITINYLGNINSFSSNDFINGAFDAWVNQITAAVANQPCDELLTNTQTSQNMFITQNLISTLTSVTAASTMSASNAVSNSVSNSNESSPKNKKTTRNSPGSGNQSNTSSNATNNNSQGNSSSSSTTQGGGTQQAGNTSNNTSNTAGGNSQGGGTNQSGNVSQGGSGQTQRGVTPQSSQNSGQNNSQGQSQGQNVSGGSQPTQGGSSSTGSGGISNSVSNAAEATSSGSSSKSSKPKVGSIVGTGDIVAIRVNEDKSNQLRGTMSVTKSNTNNTRAKGLLLNYTTTVNNSNLTLYGAFKNKKGTNTFIVANSSMIDFERNLFNTTTALESKTFGKTALMGGLNFTIGGLGGKAFTNISAVGGGFHPFKITKNLTGNILVLGVYSPFTKFYEGKWWDSGWLIVPFSSWDYAISKNFKYNVSFSGTYELNRSILQFQILTGGKILL